MLAMLGILGGMGPLASAAFVRTLYRLSPPEREQEAPACLLLSDPSFPDRTEMILRGEEEALVERLVPALETLTAAGAERVVIACFTIHAVLERVPEALRRRVIPLVALALEEVAGLPADRTPLLLLATRGSMRVGLFTRHAEWERVADRLRLLDEPEQEELHDRLYRLKAGGAPEEMLPWLETLRERAGAAGFVFGCTETHLLHEAIEAHPEARRWTVVDPLLTVARSAG
jgi:aspartate racemase